MSTACFVYFPLSLPPYKTVNFPRKIHLAKGDLTSPRDDSVSVVVASIFVDLWDTESTLSSIL